VRALLLATPILASVFISNSMAAEVDQLMGSTSALPGEAPIGHVQPRAQDFSANSPANQAEQDRLSTFDARQQKLDEALDKKLNICRC
jgi:hypothetical protein